MVIVMQYTQNSHLHLHFEAIQFLVKIASRKKAEINNKRCSFIALRLRSVCVRVSLLIHSSCCCCCYHAWPDSIVVFVVACGCYSLLDLVDLSSPLMMCIWLFASLRLISHFALYEWPFFSPGGFFVDSAIVSCHFQVSFIDINLFINACSIFQSFKSDICPTTNTEDLMHGFVSNAPHSSQIC